jgi:hypothetical protein
MTFARRGDRLRFPADLFNKLQSFFDSNPEATAAAGNLDAGAAEMFDGIVPRFANETGLELKPGYVVALANPFPDPSTDAEKFRTSAVLRAKTPATGDGATGNRVVGIVIERAAAADKSAGAAVVEGLAIVRVVPGSDASNLDPQFVAVVPGDPTACAPTANAANAFARVIFSPPVTGPTYALVKLSSPSSSAVPIKFARSTGLNQTQPTSATGRVGLVEVQPVADPSAWPASGTDPIMLAVVGRGSPLYSSDLEAARFYLPAGSKIAYLESTAYAGAVGFVVSDHDEREQFNLYWGKVRDNQGSAETRDSGHFAWQKQVRLDLVRRDTGAPAASAPKVWVMIPNGAEPKPGEFVCFRHQDGLRDGSINNTVSDQNWGEADWENGVFVALNLSSSSDDDCGAFGCGVAIGVDLPRTDSTGILRMFRGKRPDLTKPIGANNRPPRELQIGHGTLGLTVWGGTSRWLLPAMPYQNYKEPGGAWWTSPSGQSMPYQTKNVTTGRHLVTRRRTQPWKSAVELDWSPPGWTGNLYLMATQDGSATATFNRLMLRIYDGLVIGGVWFGSGALSATMGAWDPTSSVNLFSRDPEGEEADTTFDGGCCPKYDNASDVTQGP